ncbi:methyltransferase family protein [Chelativorans intermedius]|uniref:Methyltransferase family protein n=1 Tax=Chelativorans intermedius TaxID=515947 RepID=A0ABV6DC05_9HYPH|nr:isoprenylcysteine carboxylmethyltransferase family protein [Chelativorans intermedius]MCT9000328.1 isoprenylcysteine carboxylmethyltransferase family protein [Chelativorans intermedius]
MNDQTYGYGFWSLMVVNVAIYVVLTFYFFRPQTLRDWCSFGAFSVFLIVHFTEMYGTPLSDDLLAASLQNRFADIGWLSRNVGHPLDALAGWRANPLFGPFNLMSYALIASGLVLISAASHVLHAVQQQHALARTGAYAHIRHPQYVGFMLIMFGFLLQRPTLLIIAMSAVLVGMYVHLAREEEDELSAEFGEAYSIYSRRVPAFMPKIATDPH